MKLNLNSESSNGFSPAKWEWIPPFLIYYGFLFWAPESWVPAGVSLTVFLYLIAFWFREIKERESNKKEICVCMYVCMELHSILYNIWSKDRPGLKFIISFNNHHPHNNNSSSKFCWVHKMTGLGLNAWITLFNSYKNPIMYILSLFYFTFEETKA